MAARRRFLVTAVLAALVIGASAIAVTQRVGFSAPVGSAADGPATSETAVSTEPKETPIATGSQRAVYPYSVVPGGVDSVDELRGAIAADPVVANHYSGFDLSTARVERLAAPRIAHVSYRLGDRVYWTRRPLVLPAGERVITDGRTIARTRCGNQVATEPGITSPAEPDASVLDTPAIPISSCPICAGASGGATAGNGVVSPPSGSAGGVASGSGFVASASGLTAESTPANEFVPPASGLAGGAIPGKGFVPPPSGMAGGATPGNEFVPPPSGFADGATPGNGFVPPPSGLVPPPEVLTITVTPTVFPNAGGGPSTDGPNGPGTPHDDSHVETFDGPHSDLPANHEVPTPVPEPGSLMLMLIGAGAFAVRRFAGDKSVGQKYPIRGAADSREKP